MRQDPLSVGRSLVSHTFAFRFGPVTSLYLRLSVGILAREVELGVFSHATRGIPRMTTASDRFSRSSPYPPLSSSPPSHHYPRSTEY